MKIAIMQPYFFPYLGYFSLIKQTDRFVLLDTVQFINHGWIERNRILKPSDGWQYIGVPLVKHSRNTKIDEIIISGNIDWKERVFRQLEHYKRRSPFYAETTKVIRNALDIETESIAKLNENILKVVCEHLNIDLNIEIFSEMDMDIIDPLEADEWALNICKSIGNIEEYWNPEGGTEFFARNKYEQEGIKIFFLKMNLSEYNQRRKKFESGLSIIDVMMFNDIKEINKMLDNYELI